MITQATTASASVWQEGLPVLWGSMVSLREIEMRDAPSLLELIAAPEVSKFISQPPDTREAFERFIAWSREERGRGRYVCYAVVPHGMDTAIGLFHIRRLDLSFESAEWGFALGSAFWGTGVFAESAELVLEFLFDVLRVTRLEARVAVPNGRGQGALRKVGAIQEAVLRKAFNDRGRCLDQTLWAVIDTDREERRAMLRMKTSVH